MSVSTFAFLFELLELNAFCEEMSRQKFKGGNLSVERVQLNCSVLITKLENKSFSSQDDLELYFQRKKSGAGSDSVQSVVMLGADRAKVTFRNPSGIPYMTLVIQYNLY